MRALTRFGRDLRRLAAMLMLAVALAGCTHVQLAAPYDAATDTELGSVLQDTTSFVAKMVTNAGQPAGAYAQNTDFYDNMEGRLALLVARAQANRVLDNCPSTQAMARALAAADLPPAVGGKIGTPPRGDCDVVLMQLLQQQFHDLRAFHQAEGALGIPAAAVGPLLDGGLGATLRAAMAVQRAKQVNRQEKAMQVDVNGLVDRMTVAGRGLAGGIWAEMESYAIPELKKIAIQVEAIAENHAQYTLRGAEILFDMQIRAAVSVIVAMTSMTLVLVQNAINAIVDAVKDFINAATGFALV